ncbi:MAG: diversity-generating retroelement protein Avd [Bacteroidales bacterium]|nr:diversity-generating retroelement protein Avd [Bacteroidales bacterium]
MEPQGIVLKAYDLLKHLIALLQNLPRNQKFLIGDRVQNLASDILEMNIEAYYTSFSEKAGILSNVNIRLEMLRHYVRLLYDLGYIHSAKYQHTSRLVDELGRMTGGWLKSLRDRPVKK